MELIALLKGELPGFRMPTGAIMIHVDECALDEKRALSVLSRVGIVLIWLCPRLSK